MKKPLFSVHPTFFLILLIGYFTKTLFSMLTVYFCLCIHELGHAAAAWGFGVKVSHIKIMPFGISMRLFGESGLSMKKKFLISAAGPFFSIITGLLFGRSFLGTANLSLGIFNLIPAATLDGGRMFYILISAYLGTIRGYNITRGVSKLFAVLILVLGGAVIIFVRFNVSFVLIAVFLIYNLAGDCGYGRLSAIGNVLDYKRKSSDCGIFKGRSIAISKHTPLRRVLKHIPGRGMLIIHILDDNQRLISSISEKDAVDIMLKYGAGASFSARRTGE